MTYYLKLILLFLCFFGLTSIGVSQSLQGLIFADITLKNGNTLKGQMRWDNEQGIWDDAFNAIRSDNPIYEFLDKERAKQIKPKNKNFDFGFMQLWEDKIPDSEPTFGCRFGDIAYLKSTKNSVVLLGLKNGHTVSLDMNKNGDLDDKIYVYDQHSKRHILYFKDISIIRFRPIDKTFSSVPGTPLFANILTSMGIYTGYISWDSEEGFKNDIIDGKDKGNKIKIPFKDISVIKAQNDGALITMINGNNIFLNEHDDVDDGNHGITVMGQPCGNIEIEWEDFISASFITPPTPPNPYNTFKKSGILKATVSSKAGKIYKGQLIFNLNKMYEAEFLTGKSNEFQYYIPFYKIHKINPQNDKYALVILKNNVQLLLGDDSDVTDANGGVIVKSQHGKSQYIAWKNINFIDFE